MKFSKILYQTSFPKASVKISDFLRITWHMLVSFMQLRPYSLNLMTSAQTCVIQRIFGK